jgi:bifunctional UDP-N-acetylglucosamine pyrophosphorylase/glucosamine-1-phosphate N-acetyltransferase
MAAAKEFVDFQGKLVILSGDVPLLSFKELCILEECGKDATVAFLTCSPTNPAGYGRVVRDKQGKVQRIVEDSDSTASEQHIHEVNTGIYMVDVPFIFHALEKTSRKNAQQEYYLTDVIKMAFQEGAKMAGVKVENRNAVMGINDKVHLAHANRIMNQRLVKRLMRSGVTIVDPTNTYIGPWVKVGTDTTILPGSYLHGQIQIGANCVIGPGVVIENACIDEDVEVRAYSVLEDCIVGKGARVGPFAHLRSGTKLDQHVHVGNFVETKKTQIGKGSKANHLSYLGDATIGCEVNVGAGIITCNYDGVQKHPTCIEDNAFIGSDTQLVAPVRIAHHAYIAAGTTVTHDVPAYALAISRTKQHNIPDYAHRVSI